MTTSTTKTKKTTIKRKTEPKKVKLDTNCFQHEILELVSKQRTTLKKIEILQEYRNDALVSLFIWNFDDTVISMLPPGDVPYGNVKDMNSMSGSLNDKISMEANNVHTKTVAYNGTEKPIPASKGSCCPSNSLPNNINPASILKRSKAAKPAGIKPSSLPASITLSQTVGASLG